MYIGFYFMHLHITTVQKTYDNKNKVTIYMATEKLNKQMNKLN